MRLTPLIIALAVIAAPADASAQRDARKPAAPIPAAAVPAADAPKPPANYVYDVGGRRDPFVNLVNRGTEARPDAAAAKGVRPEGIAGVMVEEVAVRGIVQTRGAWVAMIAAPNGRSYTLRPGDRLLDGSVRTITGEAVMLMQDVNDPLSREKRREIRKSLRGEVKE